MKFTHTHRQSTTPVFSVSLQTSHVFGRRTLIRRQETAWQLLKKPVCPWQSSASRPIPSMGRLYIVYLPNSTQFLQLLYYDHFLLSNTSIAKPIPTYIPFSFPHPTLARPTEISEISPTWKENSRCYGGIDKEKGRASNTSAASTNSEKNSVLFLFAIHDIGEFLKDRGETNICR